MLFRVAFVAGVVFDVIKEFAAAGGGRFSLAIQWPSPSGGGFFISRAMQVNRPHSAPSPLHLLSGLRDLGEKFSPRHGFWSF